MTHDIIVIGAPVGGAAALAKIVGDLPAELEASVFVALHMRAENPILLADVLNDRLGLRAAVALDDEPIVRRRIYVPPNGFHMSVEKQRVRIVRNGAIGPRPSIDKLFTSAAGIYNGRVIGVLLLHCREDGAAGLDAIRRAGGRTITHRNEQMPAEPRHHSSGEMLCNAHLELEKIAERVLQYVHGGNDEWPGP